MSFLESITLVFQSIIARHGFQIVELGKNEVALRKGKMALWFFYDPREGVDLKYIRNLDSDSEVYAIEHFLASKREWIVCDEDVSENQKKLKSLGMTLEKSANDILEGNEGWLKDYKRDYSVRPLAQVTVKKIWGDD